MSQNLCIIFFTFFFINTAFSQSEQFELIYNPKLGKNYSIEIKTVKTINLKSVDIFVKEEQMLFGDSISYSLKDFKTLDDISINFKAKNIHNDTITFDATITSITYSFDKLENNPFIIDEINVVKKNNELLLLIIDIPFEVVVTSKGNFVSSDYNSKLIINNEDIIKKLSEEEINLLKSELDDKINITETAASFLYDMPDQTLAVNDEWITFESIENDFGKPIEYQTKNVLEAVKDSYYVIKSISQIDYLFNYKLTDSLNIETKIIGNIHTLYHIDKESGWIIYSQSQSDIKSYMDYLNDHDNNQKYGFRNEMSDLSEINIKGEIKY